MVVSVSQTNAKLPTDVTQRRLLPWVSHRLMGEQARAGYLMVLPLLLVVIGLLAYPLGYALLLSLQKKSVGVPGVFIGLGNFQQIILGDPVFAKLVRNSVVYTGMSVVFKSILGLGMALILNEAIRGRTFFRGVLLIPWVVPQTVAALNWKWILSQTGVLNYILVNLGLSDSYIPWLARPYLALLSLVLVNIWANFPFFGINFLAAMQAIPRDLYEAAEVDGASPWQRFWHVTLPGLRHVYLVLVILSTIWTWNMFTHVWLLTGGGPLDNTHLFTTYAYQVGLSGYRLGYAAAISMSFLPVLVVAIALLSPLLLRSREE
jgi:multiple sugar transport system permease protein